jgi:hypothetical protein
MSSWTTLVDPALVRPFGISELHLACFEPPDWPGKGPGVMFLIPECELQFCVLNPHTGKLAKFINRPPDNKNVKYWTRAACREAGENKAFLNLACDTEEQLKIAVRRVNQMLPHYQRVALERMYKAESRSRSKLS